MINRQIETKKFANEMKREKCLKRTNEGEKQIKRPIEMNTVRNPIKCK